MTMHTHINRYGHAYYIHNRAQGRDRKPRYVMSRQKAGALAEIPKEYEVRENVHGQVSIRRKRQSALLPEEKTLLGEAMKRSPASGYELDIDGSKATIFASSLDRRCLAECLDEEFAEGFESALAEKLPEKFTPDIRRLFRERRKATNGKRPKYYPLIRFVLADPKKRRFRVERVCFTGQASWIRIDLMPLSAALMKYMAHLGEDSFFELL